MIMLCTRCVCDKLFMACTHSSRVIVVSTQADLGLTAIPSAEVLDIMSKDFYDKYEEYMAVVAERKDRSSRQPAYSTAVTVERHQLANFIEKAVQETADWNKKMNQER